MKRNLCLFAVLHNHYLSYLLPSGTPGLVLLSPSPKYIAFQDNSSVNFTCSGNGSTVGWLINGSTYDIVSHNKSGIKVSPNSPRGGVISSTLSIPSIYNNTKIACKIGDGAFQNVQTSETSHLIHQGEILASNQSYNVLMHILKERLMIMHCISTHI